MQTLRPFLVAVGVAVSVSPARADDLVASVLPHSQSAVVGHAATVYATVINSSGHPLSDCTAALPDFPGTFAFQTTNPETNAATGALNRAFDLETGGRQSLVLTLQPQSPLAPTEERFVFRCVGGAAAASTKDINTVVFSAAAPHAASANQAGGPPSPAANRAQPPAAAPPVASTANAASVQRFTIRFDDRRAALTPSSIRALDTAVAAVHAGKTVHLAIAGCATGADRPDGSVCARRVLSLTTLLARRGVPDPKRLLAEPAEMR